MVEDSGFESGEGPLFLWMGPGALPQRRLVDRDANFDSFFPGGSWIFCRTGGYGLADGLFSGEGAGRGVQESGGEFFACERPLVFQRLNSPNEQVFTRT